ncbi:hypothetical protein DY000_02060966 [Brassica cretica]|uniref:Secreted protein n=1 Tax=Brassica cretica TaxID=69181 RepID=A0ABQ7ANI4_BRACR|nr:hypothetical protein DY000_02060966 [Brassica cretica]
MSFRSFRYCWQVVFVDVSLLQCGKLFMRSGLRRSRSFRSFPCLVSRIGRRIVPGSREVIDAFYRFEHRGPVTVWWPSFSTPSYPVCSVSCLRHRVLQSFFVGRFNYGEYSGVFPSKRSSDRRQVLCIWDKTSSRSIRLSSASSSRRWRLVWTLFIPVPDSPVV